MAKLTLPASFKCPAQFTNEGVTAKSIAQSCNRNDELRFADHHRAVRLWVDRHGAAAYKTPGFYDCSVCKIGFPSREMFAAHLLKPYGIKPLTTNLHAEALAQSGILWTPNRSNLLVTRDGRGHPTYTDLLAKHMSTVHARRDHVIVVFRQSGRQDEFHGEYLQKITRIAASCRWEVGKKSKSMRGIPPGSRLYLHTLTTNRNTPRQLFSILTGFMTNDMQSLNSPSLRVT